MHALWLLLRGQSGNPAHSGAAARETPRLQSPCHARGRPPQRREGRGYLSTVRCGHRSRRVTPSERTELRRSRFMRRPNGETAYCRAGSGRRSRYRTRRFVCRLLGQFGSNAGSNQDRNTGDSVDMARRTLSQLLDSIDGISDGRTPKKGHSRTHNPLVVGSNPTGPTIQISRLQATKFGPTALLQGLSQGLLRIFDHRTQGDSGQWLTFRSHADMAVAFQHRAAHVTHQGEHCGLGDGILSKAGTECVSRIVQAAGYARQGPYQRPVMTDARRLAD